MKKQTEENEIMLNAVEMAERLKISMRTAREWLRRGVVPGATKVYPVNSVPYWQIPLKSLDEIQRPKPGPRPRKKKTSEK